MELLERFLKDLPKDEDTLRHVQEWVNSAVTGDGTDGAKYEHQRDRHKDLDWRLSSLPIEDRWAQKESGQFTRTCLVPTPNLGTHPKCMMKPRDVTERDRIWQGDKGGLVQSHSP